MRLYSILGDASIVNTEVTVNPSPAEGQEYIFTVTMEKRISTAKRDEAANVLDSVISALIISDPEGQLADVQAERNRIAD